MKQKFNVAKMIEQHERRNVFFLFIITRQNGVLYFPYYPVFTFNQEWLILLDLIIVPYKIHA